MTEEILEKNLREFDYSVFSKVKKSLLEEILERQRMDNLKSFSQKFSEEMLSDDELDYLSAAGNPFLDDKIKKNL